MGGFSSTMSPGSEIMGSKLVIVSTDPECGGGGIASSVSNACRVLERHGVGYELIVTSRPGCSLIQKVKLFAHALWRICCLRGKGTIFYLHVGPKGSLLRKLMLGAVVKLKGGTLFVKYHSPAFYGYIKSRGGFGLSLRLLVRLGDRNLALNSYWRRIFARTLRAEFHILPNPLGDISSKNFRADSSQTVSIVTAARLVEEKNVTEVVRFVMSDPRLTLTVVGDGPELSRLKNIVKLGAAESRVDFIGWVSPPYIYDEFRRHAIFVLPSRYDSFGMVYVEALAAGIPVIAPDIWPVKATLKGLVGVAFANYQDEMRELLPSLLGIEPSDIAKSVRDVYGEKGYLDRFFRLAGWV